MAHVLRQRPQRYAKGEMVLRILVSDAATAQQRDYFLHFHGAHITPSPVPGSNKKKN
jgi:hypothetical protein